MSAPRDLRELLGDVPPTELERLARVDALLRSVPAPPAVVPESLARSVALIPLRAPIRTRRRAAAVLALAAAVAGLFFGLGAWVGGGGGFEAKAAVPLRATQNAVGAAGVIRIGERDEASGNWQLELAVSGLPRLPKDGYYVLWLARNRQYGATCGTFNVGEGTTTVRMTVSYRLASFDGWVITAQRPGQPFTSPGPWLLTAAIES